MSFVAVHGRYAHATVVPTLEERMLTTKHRSQA